MSHKILQIHILPQLLYIIEPGWCFSTRVILDFLRVKNKISIIGLVVSCVLSVLALSALSLAVLYSFSKVQQIQSTPSFRLLVRFIIEQVHNSKKAWLYHIYSWFLFSSTISSFYYQPEAVLTSSSGLNGCSHRQLCIHNISIVYMSIYKSECAVQSYSLTRVALLALHSNKPQTSIVSL